MFHSLGYRVVDECLVLQLALDRPPVLTYTPSRTWSRRVDFVVNPDPPLPTWWSACQFATLEFAAFELRLRDTGAVIAQARGWEMYPLQSSLHADCIGIVDVLVDPGYRGQGVGTLLMTQVLKHYYDNGLRLAEVQVMARNTAACRLYQRLGFQEIDRGLIYRAEASILGSAARTANDRPARSEV